jgi:hypothetical protein
MAPGGTPLAAWDALLEPQGSGEFLAGVGALQLPSVPGRLVRIKAALANTGRVALGFTSGVTVDDGATDTTTGFVLNAGDDTGWIPVANLSKFFTLGSAAAQRLTYIVLG